MSAQTDTPLRHHRLQGDRHELRPLRGSVSGEISQIPGVSSVKAVASAGEVTVVSQAPLDDEAVRAAVDEAGFELAGKA